MTIRFVSFLSLVMVLCQGTVHSATIKTGTLENGLQVYISADQDLFLTTVEMTYAAGRATDPDSLAGLAHLAEHLLTESSSTYPDGGLARQSALFSTFRNAYTGGGKVQFETQCLPEFLPQVLVLEVERVKGGELDQATFDREKSVVLEELAYRRRLSSFAKHMERLKQACYRGHPFGEKIGGTPETVGRIQLSDFEEFRRKFIRLRRAALVIRGPVDPDLTYNLADSLFTIGTRSRSEYLEVPEYPPIRTTQVISDDVDFEGVRVSIGSRIPLDSYENSAFLRSLGAMLGPSGLGYWVESVPGEALFCLNVFWIYNKPPKEKALRLGYIYQEFDADQDAQNALGYLWRKLDEELEKLEDAEVFAERLQEAMARPLGGDVGSILVGGNMALDQDQVRTALEEMQQDTFLTLARHFLNPGRAAVGVTHGRDSERQQVIELASSVQRQEGIQGEDALAGLATEDIQPVLEAYHRAGLEFVTVHTLRNRIPVMYLELPGPAPVRMGGCRALSPLKVQRVKDKPGIVQLYNRVVSYDDRQRRTAEQPSYRPKRLPFEFDLTLTPGVLEYAVEGPGEKAPRMAFHLVRRLNSQEFNQTRWFQVGEFGREILGDAAADPRMIARGWRLEQIFGSDYHDLGFFRAKGKTVEKTRYKDLVKLHKDVAEETGQTVLYGTGTIPADEFVAAVAKEFESRDTFQSTGIESPEVILEKGILGRVVAELGRGDVSLTLTFPPEARRRKGDLARVMILETLLDQALTGRLREKEGLTYAVSVWARPLSGLILWEMSVTCQPGQAPLVLRVTREELGRIATGGFSGDEVARARLALTGRLIRSLSDPDDGFDFLARAALFGGMPADLLNRVAEVTPTSINALVKSVVDPDRFAFTAVGPMFEEDIEQFDIP